MMKLPPVSFEKRPVHSAYAGVNSATKTATNLPSACGYNVATPGIEIAFIHATVIESELLSIGASKYEGDSAREIGRCRARERIDLEKPLTVVKAKIGRDPYCPVRRRVVGRYGNALGRDPSSDDVERFSLRCARLCAKARLNVHTARMASRR